MPAIDAALTAPAIVVVGTRATDDDIPSTKETIDAAKLRETIAVRNTEDSLRYFPSLFVRKRHIGDAQAPLATRTSGVGSSARSLVYADGVLLSALIGNNNNFASPRWGMVTPEEIERVDVLYGPFSAAYPGNSIGAVVNITTRMPDKLEASATVAGNLQHFHQYDTRGDRPAYQLAGTIGDRMGPFAWFLSANHVDSKSQPLAYVTALQAATASGGTPVTGAFADVDRLGRPIYVLGAGGFEHQRQDNLKLKLGLNLSPSLHLNWQSALFLNNTDSHAESYLRDGSGSAVYAGLVNIGGQRLTVPASAFSNQLYRFDERHWMHSVSIEQKGRLSWSLIGSDYDYAKDDQRIPSTALPAVQNGGAGSVLRMNGTGWQTLDFKASGRALAGQEWSGGAHLDRFTLKSRRYALADWIDGPTGALQQESLGHTRTAALWAQDRIDLASTLKLTLGARYEWWKAYDGRIFPLAAPANPNLPSRTAKGLSPKASFQWRPSAPWTITLSAGRALRFPTVSELYQSVTVGGQPRSPDPNLTPEKALSAEFAVERTVAGGHVRISLFHERIRNALLSQLGTVPGSTTPVSFVQNVDRVRTSGVEVAFDKQNILPRFDLSGSATLANPKIVSDPILPTAEGKLLPQVPRRKATLVATWRPNDRLSLTAAARYSSRMFGTIDNSDVVGHTYQGFEGYFVADVRALYHLSPHMDVALGVDNLTDKRYFLFHPFPGRTATAELHWRL